MEWRFKGIDELYIVPALYSHKRRMNLMKKIVQLGEPIGALTRGVRAIANISIRKMYRHTVWDQVLVRFKMSQSVIYRRKLEIIEARDVYA